MLSKSTKRGNASEIPAAVQHQAEPMRAKAEVEAKPRELDMPASPTKGNGHMDKPQMPGRMTYTPPLPRVDELTRHAMIASEAYYAAERRGFKGGSAQEDWLAAEKRVNERLGLHIAS
jgi:hypothetical protein